jgi:hypothetical protein
LALNLGALYVCNVVALDRGQNLHLSAAHGPAAVSYMYPMYNGSKSQQI